MSGTQRTPAYMLGTAYVPGQVQGIGSQDDRDFVVSVGSNLFMPFIYAGFPPYNVVADGTDQTAKLQNALNDADAKGQLVLLPYGAIVINGTGLIIPSGVSLRGQTNQRSYTGQPPEGTLLVSPSASYAAGTNPIMTLQGYTTIRDLAIYGAGSDGFGNGTSRPNIQSTTGSNLLDNVNCANGHIGFDGNYLGQNFFTNCHMAQNSTGMQNLVDSKIDSCVFNSNGTDVSLGPGANHNRFGLCRFEFCGTGHSINGDGSSNTSTAVTNATTASGNASLHFASAPAGALQGYMIYDQTTPAAIPAGTYVTSASPGTTITMSANAAGPGVGAADTLVFYVPNNKQNVFVGCQWDRPFLNAINMNYCTQWSVTGGKSSRGGVGATANTSNDAHVRMAFCSTCVVSGMAMNAGQSDALTGPYSPSFGVWDGGGNFNCIVRGHAINWNPVDGTHGGGINALTTFATFNSDNAVARANIYQIGQP